MQPLDARVLGQVCHVIAARRHGVALAGVLLVFLFRLLLAIAVIPPWQNPDERQHFAFVRLLARQQTTDLSVRRDLGIEQEILRSMAEHGWWAHYDERVPDPLPKSYSEVPAHLNVVPDFPPIYYLVAAQWLKLTGTTGLLDQYYALRWLAIVLAAATLWCIWAGAELMFGARVALGATLLVALHLQFALVSIAANPDLMVNLLGAAIWWQAARLLTGRTPLVSVLALIVFAVLGVFTKRSAGPLVGVVAVICGAKAICLARVSVHQAFMMLLTGVVTIAAVAAIAWLVPEEAARVWRYFGHLATFATLDRVFDWDYSRRYVSALFDSSWLMAGWLRYSPPAWWLLAVRALVLVSVAGLVFFRGRPQAPRWKDGLLVAAVFVFIHVAGVAAGPYLSRFGPQGRYLFPAIGPWMSILWIGFHVWWPRRFWPAVSVGLLGFMLLLDVIVWTEVLIPAYVF